MNLFNIIAGLSSIISLIVSIIAIKKVINIEKQYIDNSDTDIRQNVKTKSIVGGTINQTGVEKK